MFAFGLPNLKSSNFISFYFKHRMRLCAKFAVFLTAAFLKLWSADHKWSSGSALVVLLD